MPVKAAFEAECNGPKKRTRKHIANSYDDEEDPEMNENNEELAGHLDAEEDGIVEAAPVSVSAVDKQRTTRQKPPSKRCSKKGMLPLKTRRKEPLMIPPRSPSRRPPLPRQPTWIRTFHRKSTGPGKLCGLTTAIFIAHINVGV